MRPNLYSTIVLVLATLLACAVAASASAAGPADSAPWPPLAARPLRGAGSWQREGQTGEPGGQQWDIDVTRSDGDALEGRVTIAGSPLLQSGTLRGHVAGRRVTGSIADAQGNHVAAFVGALTPGGALQGTYQDRTGEVGRWSWEGPPPR